MSIRYLPDTEKIVEYLMEVCESLKRNYKYTDIPVLNFPVDNIRMLYFIVGLEPRSMAYGRGIGAFVYEDGRVFQFHYNIHTPHSKGPHLSNQMTSIEEVVWIIRDDESYIKTQECDFGRKAFWKHTPDSSLNEEEKTLRALMRSLQEYCRKENYCKKLRDLDTAHETWQTIRQARILQLNSHYGITNVVSRDESRLWCENQTIDSEDRRTCLAYLAEGRALDCPYVSPEAREQAEHPCSDYKKIGGNAQ